MKLRETPPSGGHGRARGLVSGRQSGRRIDAHTYAPPDDLRELVAAFWCGRWDLPADAPHETHLLSDPCVHIAFETAGPHAGGRVVGVWTRLWRRVLEGRGQVRAVKLQPGALRAFADVRPVALQNRIVPLSEVLPDAGPALERAILEPPDVDGGFAVLADWLRTRQRGGELERVRLAIALARRIAEDPAITRVEQLARVTGESPRSLQRLFREHVGVSPKWVIRRPRLQEVALRLEAGEAVALARLAAELGYTDQAHLTRDFKAAVGKSPREFAEVVWRT